MVRRYDDVEAAFDEWEGRSDRGFDRQGHQSMEAHRVRLPLVNWWLVVVLGTFVAATACFAGDCPLKRIKNTILPRATLTGHDGTVGSVVFRPGGEMMASVGLNGSTVLWDLKTLDRESVSPMGAGQDHCIAFSALTASTWRPAAPRRR